jgi:hypothetical protein
VGPKGPPTNDVTAVGRRGYQGLCDNITKALLLKSVTMGEGVSKIIQNCVTSFMDDPKKSFTSVLSYILFLRKINSAHADIED